MNDEAPGVNSLHSVSCVSSRMLVCLFTFNLSFKKILWYNYGRYCNIILKEENVFVSLLVLLITTLYRMQRHEMALDVLGFGP